jgi:hypothetical protein
MSLLIAMELESIKEHITAEASKNEESIKMHITGDKFQTPENLKMYAQDLALSVPKKDRHELPLVISNFGG